MNDWVNESTNRFCDALLHLENLEECYAFLEDVCTIREIMDLAQRLSVAKMLSEKVSYSEINAKTGASSATICRVSKCLEYGNGGYKKILERIKESEHD